MIPERWIWPWLAIMTVAAAQEEPPQPVHVVTTRQAPVVERLELTGSETARRQARARFRRSDS